MILSLSGLAPINCFSKDEWGWSPSRNYSAAQGYSELQAPLASSISPVIWKFVWSSYCLPKVNFFSWLLVHKRVLTWENPSKRGFHGPFRCCLCNDDVETSDHLFIECDFFHLVWELVLHGLVVSAPSQISMVPLFVSWLDRIPFPIQTSKKSVWKNVWHIVLKCVF